MGGAFAYILPQSYFPEYDKHPARYGEENELNYQIKYSFKILSAEQITYISAPEGVTTQVNPEKTEAVISGNQLSKNIRFYFRTKNMLRPRLLFEENEAYPDEVAVMASFVPNFEPSEPQEIEMVEDEVPESSVLSNGKDFLYVFIVDRSGSMSGRRMDITKEAMILFIKSLPVGSKF